MRFLGRSLLGLILLAATLGLLTWGGSMVRDAAQARMADEPRSRPNRERVFSVNILPVTFDSVSPVLSAFGEVQSLRTLELRSAASGTVIDLDPAFVEGGRVEAGQLLAQIDPADAEAALDRAENNLLDAQAEQREADRAIVLARDELAAAEQTVTLRQRALRRQRDRVARNVGTADELESAELSLASAEQSLLTERQSLASAEARVDQSATALRRAEIARDESRRRLSETEIRAKFAGTLSDVTVVAGRLVSANEQLAQLVDPDALEVAFRVSTLDYARLLDEAGQLQTAKVTAALDVFGTDISASGHLSREGASVAEGLTGRLLFATLDTPRGFKPGDFVTVSVEEQPLNFVARVPATAVDAGNMVLALGPEDRLEAVEVSLLRRQGDDVLIRSRDLRGREIVAERTPLLGAGIKVKPLRAGTTAPEEPQMVELDETRRAKLIAFVEGNTRMPKEAKARILGQLAKPQVPAQMVERIESRMGG